MKMTKRLLAILLCVALMCGVMPLSLASAATVIPRSVQIQWRDEWLDDYYGTTYRGNLYDTGCGIFSTVNAVGYLTGNEMSITEVAQWAYDIKALNYYAGGVDRTIMYPKLEEKFGADYGFKVVNSGTWSKVDSTLKNHLLNGGVSIAHVSGHFIAIVGYDASTGYFHVYDSAPSTARGTGNGDAWVSESWITTSTYFTVDWYSLLSRTGTVINRDYGQTTSGTTADKIGTYMVNTETLNVRDSSSTAGSVVTTVKQGDLLNVKELASNGWGRFTAPDGVEGWSNVTYYGKYIGVDALAGDVVSMNDVVKVSRGADGSLTLNNPATGMGIVDLMLPQKLGTLTTPYFSLGTTHLSGSGYYFGLTQYASGYFMMRDCSSANELVNATSAPYMTTSEKMEIDLFEWWDTTDTYQVDMVRFYIAPKSSMRIDYCYFTEQADVVNDTSYNTVKSNPNVTLLTPDSLAIPTDTKKGSYSYQDGVLTLKADTDAGFDVVVHPNVSFDVNTLRRLLIDVDTAIPFNVSITLSHKNGDGTLTLCDDYYPDFNQTWSDSGYLSAVSGTAGLDLYSYFNYNGVLPTDGISVVKEVKFSVGAAGTATFKALQLAPVDLITYFNDGVSKSGSCEGVIEPEPDDKPLGDVNGDGVVSTVDARMIISYLIGEVSMTEDQIANSDFDGNGTVSTTDVRAILASVLV